LAYIKLAWGGPTEQEAEIAAGNPDARDWHDEAKILVEKTVRCFFFQFNYYGAQYNEKDGGLLQNSSFCCSHSRHRN
jgi:hypothetical protein